MVCGMFAENASVVNHHAVSIYISPIDAFVIYKSSVSLTFSSFITRFILRSILRIDYCTLNRFMNEKKLGKAVS